MSNKLAIVTGASTGIGRAIAQELAKDGAWVALVGRNENRLTKTQKLIEKDGGHADVYIVNLADTNSVSGFTKLIGQHIKKVDILVNAAGIWHGENEVYANRDFDTFTTQVILDTYTVGITAPTLLAHACIPLMAPGSKIINISGTFENGGRGWLPYYVSKRATEDLTVGLAEELKNKSIQVNAVSPSDTATEAYAKYFPQYIHEAINPQTIAKHVTYLCSAETNVTGKIFVMKKDREPYEGFHQ